MALVRGIGLLLPGLDFHRRQADVFRLVALQQEEQHGDREHHQGAGDERHAPVMEDLVGPPAGEGRGHQAAEGVAGAPVAQHTAAFAGGEEAADVLAQPRPAGGLGQALDQHAGGEDRQGGEGAHGHRRQGRDHQAAEDHHARAEAVGEDAPGELAHGVGGEVDGIEVGHHGLVEFEVRVFANAELGDGEGLAGEIEGGVGQPGDEEDLDAPALEGFPAAAEGTCVVVHGSDPVWVCRTVQIGRLLLFCCWAV
ncbi:hypothetical protein D9M68_487160 [compost metagenome]